ncbi:MAG TPA: radical SAM protein [Bryobacteraceae bacterium]|jgi:radical SAM superfamily enzyme YgiQ (UPF0313 family)|nr:radical SAM protein [Bryobacteraceae bacterium]
MSRFLLINSPSHEPGKVLNKAGRWIPGEQLGLCYLAAILRRANHTVEIWDAFMLGISAAEVAARLDARLDDFDIIGLSVSDGKVHGCALLLELLQDLPSRLHLTLGGHTATLCAKEFLANYPRVDSVIRGEGEIPVLELANALAEGAPLSAVSGISFRLPDGKIQSNKMPQLSHDLDQLPFPARDNIELCLSRRFSVSLETSRGCKGVCTFCATRMMYQPSIGRTWRARSVENVLAEVEILINEHGVRRIAFEDEDFLGFGSANGFERARALAEEILRRGLEFEWAMLTRVDNVDRDLMALLQKAGLRFVFLGAETGSQRSLDFYLKETTVDQNARAIGILRALGIDHEVLWIMYDPETTLEDLEANLDFLKHLDSLNVNLLNRLRVYHGTPMHARLARNGRLRGTFLEYDYDFHDPRVTLFEREATNGLNAFYQVLNRADVLKWELGDTHPLTQLVTTVSQRVHVSATIWLRGLIAAIRQQSDVSRFSGEAVSAAADCARLLARLVAAWKSATKNTSEAVA